MKRPIGLLIVSIFLLLLAGCKERGTQSIDIGSPDSEYNTVADCDKASGAMKNNCYSSVAAKLLDGTLCDKIGDGAMSATCYTNIVEQTKDGALCAKIEKDTMRSGCYQVADFNKEIPTE